MKKYGGGGCFEGKALYFCGGGGGGGCFVFSQSSGQLAFVKNILQVMFLLKNVVCSNGIR